MPERQITRLPSGRAGEEPARQSTSPFSHDPPFSARSLPGAPGLGQRKGSQGGGTSGQLLSSISAELPVEICLESCCMLLLRVASVYAYSSPRSYKLQMNLGGTYGTLMAFVGELAGPEWYCSFENLLALPGDTPEPST